MNFFLSGNFLKFYLLLICFVLFHHVSFGLSVLFYYYHLDVCFLMRGRKGVNPDWRGAWEEMRKVKGGVTIIRTHVRKIIFYINASNEMMFSRVIGFNYT